MPEETVPFNGPLLGHRYQLGPVLGHGGMSVVHRAQDLVTGAEVAVKLFAPGVALDARLRQQREVTLSRGLNHPAIATLVDYSGPEAEPAYLVSELVDGPTLRARINGSPLTPAQVGVIGARLSEALVHLHSHGIVHRDIKPANVLLPGDDDDALANAKLADFGVAIRLEDTRVTVAGNVVGTATYLSPEQVTGATISSASDVYSLGLVLAECLVGEPAFAGSGVECALARLHRAPVIPSDLPAGLSPLLRQMTAMDPHDRPDAAHVHAALRDGAPLVPAPTTVMVIDSPARRGTFIRRGAIAAAGLAMAGLAAVVLNGAGSPSPTLPSPTTNPAVAAHVPSTTASTAPHIQVVATSSSPSTSVTAVRKTAAPGPQGKPAKKPGPPGHGGPGHGGPGHHGVG